MPTVIESIESLKAYQPGKPISELEREFGVTNAIKLASNENPLGPSPKAILAIQKAAQLVHLYPDGAAFDLRQTIAKFHNVDMAEVLTGNGSNEVLNLVARTFLQPGKDRALMFKYAFIAYPIILKAFGVAFDVVDVNDQDFEQSLDKMFNAIQDDTKLICIANPNNPTGTFIDGDALRAFLEKVPEDILVIVDEAYVEFINDPSFSSALDLRATRENLVVTRTFSKCYALAGLRVGYAVGPPKLIDYVNRVREPFNCNLIAQAAAIASLGDREFVARSVSQNTAVRAELRAGLEKLSSFGVKAIPSQTNFILVRTPRPGVDIYNALLREGIIVRPLKGYGLEFFVRVSVGSHEENNRFLDAFAREIQA